MTKENAIKIVADIFTRINQATSMEELEKILKDEIFDKYRMKDEKYPRLNFMITKEDFEKEENKGKFNLNKIPTDLDLSNESLLTKLLYAIVWKNGDLGKEEHIIKGIKSTDDTERIVFYQLGKHLSNSKEPIYDQHVLRAFQFYENGKNDDFKVIGDSVTKKEHGGLAKRYVEWISKIEEVKQAEDFTYWIDKILFALGKKIKKELA